MFALHKDAGRTASGIASARRRSRRPNSRGGTDTLIFTRPYITKRFIAYAGETYTRDLSLAVAVVDAFTRQPPLVPLRALLKELPRLRVTRNRSGFFCFEDVKPPGAYTLVVEPDRSLGDWYYLQPLNGGSWTDTFERPVNLPRPDPKSPLVNLVFSPKPSYPFPENATLARGRVTQGTAAGVADAVVSTTYQQSNPPNIENVVVKAETLTDRQGEFVLFFEKLPENKQTVKLMAEKSGKKLQQPVSAVITEGTTQKGIRLDLPL